MTRSWARALASAWIVLVSEVSHAQDSSGGPVEASTERVERCVSEHDSARQLLLQERWLDARTAMSHCAAEECPLAIATDCSAWLDELNRMLPTALLLLEREPNAPAPVRIDLDGRAFSLPDPSAPVELLPGPHRVRLSFSARPPIVRDFVLEKGEKNHIERLAIPALPTTAPPTPALVVQRSATRPIPLSTYALSAGAVASFAGSTAGLVAALRERSDARATCAPSCDPSVRKSIKTRLIVSDLSAALGLTLSALAVYTFAARPLVVSTGPALAVTHDGLTLSWRGGF